MTNQRILIIEPDGNLSESLSEHILQPNKFESLLARNSEDGINLALSENPRLLIIHLPLAEATGLLQKLLEAGRTIPSILIIKRGLNQIAVELLRLGVRDCIAYPFDPEEVLLSIQRVLGQESETLNHQQVTAGLDEINQELEQRLKKTEMLFRIGRSVSASLDLDSVLNRVTEAAVYITRAEEGYLLLLEEETGELHLRAAQNLGEKQAQGFSLPVSDSIAGEVVRSGQPILLGSETEQNFKVKSGYLVRSLLNVPLKTSNGHVIGVLGVNNQVSDTPFTHEHLTQLSLLANMATTALENARQHTEMRKKLTRQVKEFSTLQAIAGQLGAVTDFDMRAGLALSLLLNTLNAEAAVLAWAADEYRQAPRFISQGTLSDTIFNDRGSTDCWWDKTTLHEVIKTGQPLLNNSSEQGRNGNGTKTTRSELLVPIKRGQQAIGVINIASPSPRIFSQDDLRFVSSVANQVGIALEETLLQERAATDRERLLSLMSAVDNAVWLVDTDMKVIFQNDAAGELVGSDAVGQSLCDLLVSNDHSNHELCQIFNWVVEERQPLSLEEGMVLTTKNQQSFLARGKITPVTRGEQVTGALCTFHKVPPEKNDEYVRLEFANMASHLLRTPLSFIQMSIDLLMNSDLSPEERQKTLERMWERSRSLTEFTDELLEILRLEVGSVPLYIKPVSLLALVERVLSLVQYEAAHHKFNVVAPDALPAVAADSAKTELVLFNLLTNAVNRCPNGGHITIKPEIGTTEINVAVIDDGEPIPTELLDRVFGQFYPVDDNGKMPTTYQLGLYTTKRLVELQNGRIWANSGPGQGSKIGFSLPIWEK